MSNIKEVSKGITFHSIYKDVECDRITKEFVEKYDERFKTLTTKEKILFRQIFGKSGVLFLQGKPGIAKSAKMRSIAMKMGMLYIDFRLSMVDETDVGMYPTKVTKVVDGIPMDFLDHVPPMWAFESNRVPTLIHFEELNRASQHVRNAAMQILLERAVGVKFHFNENVLMVCSGNLGDEDNTDVEELDKALNGRLIHKKYTLSTDEWLEDFARENVNPVIVRYIEVNGDQLYPSYTNNDESAYPSPRSWTFLSDYIKQNFSKRDEKGNFKEWGEVNEYIGFVSPIAHEYIGTNAARKFCQYMSDMLLINITDIINNYPKHRSDVREANQSRWADWMHSLKEISVDNINEKQVQNIIEFLKDASGELRISYLLYIVDKNTTVNKKTIQTIASAFKDEYKKISASNTFMQQSNNNK